jgi:hypothetical protein
MPNMIKKGMINSEALWNVYYYFFLFGVSLGLIEYILIFSGYLLPRTIQTPAGTFATGYFSILIPLGSGEIYERFHGFLLEPGSLAMYLLSAMSYAIIYKKYVGLIIFIIGFLLTYSLGGYIGLAMLIPILLFIKARKKVNKLQYISLVSFICIASYFASPLYSDFFLMQYEQKQISSSATDRENATERYLPNMVTLAMDYPFGMRFTRNTVEAEKNRDYFGSTFAPGNAFIHGGILGLFGYILILILSLLISISIFFKKNISDIEIVVGSSLFVMLPFIWQREVIWDTALFPILFAPTILYHLSRLKFNQNAK